MFSRTCIGNNWGVPAEDWKRGSSAKVSIKRGLSDGVAREEEKENLLENKTHFPENQASFQF